MIKAEFITLDNLLDENLNSDSKLHFHPAGSMGFSNNEYAIEFDNNKIHYWNKISGLKEKKLIPKDKMDLFKEMYNLAKNEACNDGKAIEYLDETHYVISGTKAIKLIEEFNAQFF